MLENEGRDQEEILGGRFGGSGGVPKIYAEPLGEEPALIYLLKIGGS